MSGDAADPATWTGDRGDGEADAGRPRAMRAGTAWRLQGRPSAVVFDCDGVLVDTEPIWGQAERILFERRGVGYTAADRDFFSGLSVAVSAAEMATRFGEDGAGPQIADELVDAVIDLLAEHARPMAGVVDLIARAAEAGVPTAVASNSPERAVRASLGAAGLLDSFEVVVTVDDVARPKPDPEPYLQACERLGADPCLAVGIEDSRTGLAAAVGAGMATIGVPVQPGDFGADLVVPDLAHRWVREWVNSW